MYLNYEELKMKHLFFAVMLLSSCVLAAQEMSVELDLDNEAEFKGPLFKPSQKPVNLTIPLKNGNDVIELMVRLNSPGILYFTLVPEKGKKEKFSYKPIGQTMIREKSDAERKGDSFIEITKPEDSFKNQMIEIGNLKYPIRPSFEVMPERIVNKLIPAWDLNLPDALQYNLLMRFIQTPAGVRVDIDGRYWRTYKNINLKELNIAGGAGPTITHKEFKNKYNTDDWEALYIAGAGWGGAMSKAVTSIKPGFQLVGGIPMNVAVPEQSVDISTTFNYYGLKDDTVDVYLSRNSFNRNPLSYMLSVPNGHYCSAWILFALDPDKNKDRAFCIRMSRFNGASRGSGFAYTDVFLPKAGEPMPENIKQVGTVELNGKTIPLYLGEFPIRSGDIADLVSKDPMPDLFYISNRRDALDFELLNRRRSWVSVYGTNVNYPHGQMKSAVNVFGVTLKRCPLQFEPLPRQVCNIFKDDEAQETGVRLTAVKTNTSILTWKIFDAYRERLLDVRSMEISLEKDKAKEVTCSLSVPDIGHYNVDFELAEKGSAAPYFVHHAAFSVLGPDTRLATPSESPFCMWWFQDGMHYAPSDPEFVLNILNRAGIRHTSFSSDDPKESAARKKYRVTRHQLPWIMDFPEGSDDDVMAALHKFYDPLVKNNPDTKMVLLWHESFGGGSAPELFGGRTKPGNIAWAVRQLRLFSKFMRENYPDIKIVMGNSGIPVLCTASLLAEGFSPKSWDYVGIEALGLAALPEMLFPRTPASTWLIKKVGSEYGADLKTTGCFEFTSRRGDALGWKKQAEFYTRDGLVGLAFGFVSVALAGMPYSDAYCQSVYGGGDGFISRDLYPRPFFTAYAALTKVFDQIDFKPRIRQTGANTTYAVGFSRKRGDFAYALWTPKNEAEVKVSFPHDVELVRIGFFGRETKEKGREFTFIASGTPQYFTAPEDPAEIRHVRAILNEDPAAVMWTADLTDPAKLKNWAAAPIPGTDESCIRRPGSVEVAKVNDEEMGECLEFTLIRDKPCPEICTETSYWRLKEPLALPGTPDTIAALVKGDGGWGEIIFDLQDGNGNLIRTGCRGGCGNDALLNIHFTGWNWIRHHLNGGGLRNAGNLTKNLGSSGFFRGDSKGGGGYPFKLVGIWVNLRRASLNPAQMTPVPGRIRIKKLGCAYHPEFQPEKVK